MHFSTEDVVAVLAAPLLLFGVLRLVRMAAPRVGGWPPGYVAGLWVAVLATLAALLGFSVTVNVLLLAWIFAALGAWNVTRLWLAARRSASPRSRP